MFERTLSDLIRGLRASSKKDEPKFISLAINEIRSEVRSKDMELKAAAILKLTYLDMLGYDMSWASFHVVEVMSSSKIHLKAVGYLAAVQSFKADTDVIMLTTNTLKKDIASPHPADITIALDGLSHIVTPDLGRDLSHDLIAMLNHSRPRIRKRAILMMYKVLMKYPEVLPHSFNRLREKLDDPDSGVVSATVNVLCELARRDPQYYLPLAPQLFDILTKSSNNWMLIKVIKLLGALAPFEPRLVKKLQKPVTDLISTTPAVSLLYECVHTCIIGGMLEGPGGNSLAKTCIDKLAAFLRDPDQNLKYISLLAMAKIVPSHPHLVAAHQDEIISSIEDQDISIRMRALDLVSSMVTDYNLQSIVQRLLAYLVPSQESTTSALPSAAQSLARTAAAVTSDMSLATPVTRADASPTPSTLTSAYRLEVCRRIITMCSRDAYENVTDFEWYLSVLVDLAYVSNVGSIGRDINDKLLDVVVRVRGVRTFAVGLMLRLLNDEILLENCRDPTSCSEVLWAAAWICGEYCSELASPQELAPLLLQPNVMLLPDETITIYLQSALKIFGHWAAEVSKHWDEGLLPEIKDQVDKMISNLDRFTTSPHIEVQERVSFFLASPAHLHSETLSRTAQASNIFQLLTFMRVDLSKHQEKLAPSSISNLESPNSSLPSLSKTSWAEPSFPKSLYLIRPLHVGELNAIAPQPQANVRVPEGLDLGIRILKTAGLLLAHEEGIENASPTANRRRKGKGKAEDESAKEKSKGTKKKKRDHLMAEAYIENPGDAAAREKRRAERIALMRDDPYYLVDDPPHRSAPQDDVDSIPIIRLDDLPSGVRTRAFGPTPVLSRSSYTSLRSRSSTPVVVDRGGEVSADIHTPTSATPPVSLKSPTTQPSSSSASGFIPSTKPLSRGFPPYELDDDDGGKNGLGVSAPEPIQVTRVKKKVWA
ncbi:hypothetical protein BS47DRAFT_1372168 [Hydnum rufescens UP504]|uniref:AP-3 complex subunit delta n=1 Tax=Hydnum rufescens UP504 TaxID=1448309 RepID=A0A9P6AZU7_9AGAM|nr:hypothetical protein BS47DRAFT_1372168 [Hydnum rufescens UP504]